MEQRGNIQLSTHGTASFAGLTALAATKRPPNRDAMSEEEPCMRVLYVYVCEEHDSMQWFQTEKVQTMFSVPSESTRPAEP